MSKPGTKASALIVGSDPASARAALELAHAGVAVTLLTADHWLSPVAAGPAAVPVLLEAAKHMQIDLVTDADVQAIRSGERGLRVTLRQRPRYVDHTRCTACGACAEVCPVELPGANVLAHLRSPTLEGDAVWQASLRGHEESSDSSQKAIFRGGVPTTYAIEKAGTAPCREACPIGQRAQGYAALVRAGDFQAAYETIKRDNPFPTICGRVCNRRCEDACSRGKVDAPVNIMGLKRFVTDWVWQQRSRGEWPVIRSARDEWKEDSVVPTGKKVAVVGAGPAGLTAALDLVRRGHTVTVFEALPVAGGMMRVGVPEFRLPYHLVELEIEDILSEGVELVLNHRVENVPELLSDSFDAVFVAAGAHKGLKLPIPGADLPEVQTATDFLRSVSLRDNNLEFDFHSFVAGRRVLVLGGGNVAVDAAMVAVRLGASWVGITCLESRDKMPAHEWEVRDAEEEGVEVFPSRTFKEITNDAGHVTGVRCARIDFRGFKDGRPDFDELPGTQEVIATDVVVFSVGQRPEIDCLKDQIETVRGRFPAVDPETLATSLPGVYAGGDMVTGTAFIVDAIAAGHKAAHSIDRCLQGLTLTRDQTRLPAVELEEAQARRLLDTGKVAVAGRVEMKRRPAAERRRDFREACAGLTESEARTEAARCLNCGICSECLECEDRCPAGAIDHEQQPQTWDILAGAVILTDDGERSDHPEAELSLSRMPGVFWVGDDVNLEGAVAKAMAHLNVARPAPRTVIAAPSFRQLAVSSTGPLVSQSRVLRPHISRDAGGQMTIPFAHVPRHPFSQTLQGLEVCAAQLGVFLCRCGGEIDRVVDLSAVAARVRGLSGVAYVGQVDFACHIEGNVAIREVCAAHSLDGAILAACSCCALDQICYSCSTQRIRCKERLGVWDSGSDLPIDFVNIREQCVFVHRDDATAATLKAGDMVAAAVAAYWIATGERRLLMPGPRVPTSAAVDLVRCRGCEDCELICGLDAIQVVSANGARIAQVDPSRCAGCGVCMAVCSSGAILASDASDAQVESRLSAMKNLSDKTVVFCCNWGAYSAVEAAGVERRSYDPSVRLVRLLCAGRAHDGLIMRAFVQGAARVMLLMCGYGDDASQCQYHTGNDQARRSVEQTRRLLELLGIDSARLDVVELQPGDGAQFVTAVAEFLKATREIAPEAGD